MEYVLDASWESNYSGFVHWNTDDSNNTLTPNPVLGSLISVGAGATGMFEDLSSDVRSWTAPSLYDVGMPPNTILLEPPFSNIDHVRLALEKPLEEFSAEPAYLDIIKEFFGSLFKC